MGYAKRLVGSRSSRSGGSSYFPGTPGILTFSTTSANDVLGVTIQAVLDPSKICKKLNEWEKRILNRTGAYTRAIMKNSMKRGTYRPDKRRRRKEMSKEEKLGISTVPVRSKPGQAPKYWNRLIKDSIFYYIDPYRAEVIVGPNKLNRRDNALEVLEFGGTVKANGKNLFVAPRPYADPAQDIGAMFMSKLIRTSKNVF